MFGQSLLSAFGIACTTDTDQLFTTDQSVTSTATYQLNNATTSIPSNTYPGTASNITYTTGKFGDAAVFNGSSSSIGISSSTINPANVYSISMWVNFNNASAYTGFFANNTSAFRVGEITIIKPNATKLQIFSGGQAGTNLLDYVDAQPSSSFVNNTWYHIVVISDRSISNQRAKVFVNGTECSYTAYGANQASVSTYSDTKIGLADNQFFPGKIDQVRIFNSDLSQAAITALYNETTTTATSASIDYQLANPNSIAYYKMSSAADQLGNYNGTATNVNFNTEGKFGFAGAFNGSSSIMNLGDHDVFSPSVNALSISCWINTTSTIDFIFSKGGSGAYEYGLFIDGSGQIGLQAYTLNASSSVSINTSSAYNDGNWHHVVGIYDPSGNFKIYVDGSQQATSSSSLSMGNSSNALIFGKKYDTSSDFFNGKIDQIRIYNSVISAANVSTLYKEVECEPVAINALANFNTVTYDGTGGSQSTNSLSNQAGTLGFAPGMTWIKSRSNATWHEVHDVVRGNLPRIFPNDSYQELTSANGFASFDSNGFSLDAAGSGGDVNTSGRTYVAWNWKTALANLSTGFNGSSTVGSASKIDLTGSTTLTTRSISLWVNLAGTGSGGNLILDNSDGQNPGVVQYGKWVIQLQYGGTNYFCWDTYTGGSYGICDVNYTFNLNTWYHIVFVAEANNQAVYINGVSQTLQNVSRAGDIGTVTMSTNRLGASWSTQYTHALNGKMGQVRIFNDALTANEVADLYTEPAASNNTLNYPAGAGCIAAYPLQTNAVDLSGNYSGASSNVTFGQPGYLTSNTDGTITSTVAANPEAGFSVVKYTGIGSTASVGHGLGVVPKLIIAKCLNITSAWVVYSETTGINKFIELNDTAAATTNSGYWGSSAPTTSVFEVKNGNVNNNSTGNDIIAYCFADITGYSKVGSYVGNGSSNPLYVGFQPKFVMAKQTTGSGGSWLIMDSTRGANKQLYPNLNSAEYSDTGNSFSSTGFTMKSNGNWNNSGETYIYLAIA